MSLERAAENKLDGDRVDLTAAGVNFNIDRDFDLKLIHKYDEKHPSLPRVIIGGSRSGPVGRPGPVGGSSSAAMVGGGPEPELPGAMAAGLPAWDSAGDGGAEPDPVRVGTAPGMIGRSISESSSPEIQRSSATGAVSLSMLLEASGKPVHSPSETGSHPVEALPSARRPDQHKSDQPQSDPSESLNELSHDEGVILQSVHSDQMVLRRLAAMHKLLSETSKDIAKSVSLDGKMSPQVKKDLEEAFEQAKKLGCEESFTKSVNSALKSSGSSFRIVLDQRQSSKIESLDGILKGAERSVSVVNIEEGKVTDEHKFRVEDLSRLFERLRPKEKGEPLRKSSVQEELRPNDK
ncbi:MAG: hypothetical protein K2W95_29530 [Candidatus Obscuribacterales bacterium]|nr:hypothetical protein [Candidatus Obscuribacterales bacterium]